MNILIIGHPGSGKTYLANLLSRKLKTEKVDIDVLFDKHPFYAFSKKQYEKALNRLLDSKKNWVIDGYHVGLMPDKLFMQADTIIYLNFPKKELRSNVLARYHAVRASGESSHWQSVRINNLKNFAQIRYQDRALQKDLVRIKNLISGRTRFIELKSRDDIDKFSSIFPE